MQKKYKFAVILCTLNEEKTIENRINNLLETKIPANSVLDIYIFDNHSTDQTRKIIEESVEYKKKVFLFDTGRTGKCNSIFTATNILMESYDYFILTDANTTTKTDFLEILHAKILEDCSYDLFVCNMRHVKMDRDGIEYFASSNNRLSVRHRIEERLGKSSGANGGLYMVSAVSMQNIVNLDRVRNDDFIISCYAQRNGKTAWCAAAKAFETEYSDKNLFRAKFRDARGHMQALAWLFRNIESKWTYYFVCMRLFFWFTPLIFFILILLAYPSSVFLFLTLMFVSGRIRILTVKFLALHLGIVSSAIFNTPSQWSPLR